MEWQDEVLTMFDHLLDEQTEPIDPYALAGPCRTRKTENYLERSMRERRK